MKKLTSSIYSFENLIEGDFLYIDKTEYIWQMIQPAGGMYFLSRPRRFGKSLTLSTLKAVFEGKKELFKGLALYDKTYEWKKYPVIHLSFGDYNVVTDAFKELSPYLMTKIRQIAASYSIELTAATPGLCFGELVDALATRGQVVILVDEYDKPILDNIDDPDISLIQRTLKGFYSVLKDRNEKERFLFVTGVSKFSHVSLFSDLNNLTDISIDARFATMLGYTQEELEAHFGDRIAALAGNGDLEACKAKIKKWYNGYRFEENSKTVYNPVSLANFFERNGKFSNYWFSTGTPSFLLKLIKTKRFDLEEVLEKPVSSFALDAYEVDNLNPLTLLLQTGYLTIDKAVERYGDTAYQLCFPNLEVKGSFETYLAGDCSGLHTNQVKEAVYALADEVTSGNVDGFMEAMKVFFAQIPYDVHLKNENNFQLLFYSIFLLLGISITAESRTNNGRIDAVATNEDFVFVFEFKLNKSEEIALEQIKSRDYYRRYMDSGKTIRLVGVNFDNEAGQIVRWTYETV